jgi:hypothetical protein
VDANGEGNEDGVGNSLARSGARPSWSGASCSGGKRRLEMGAASVRVGNTSAARICGGKVWPTPLASAQEGEEKGGGQREIAGSLTTPKSATTCGRKSGFRRAISSRRRRLRLGIWRGNGEWVQGNMGKRRLPRGLRGKRGGGDGCPGSAVPEKEGRLEKTTLTRGVGLSAGKKKERGLRGSSRAGAGLAFPGRLAGRCLAGPRVRPSCSVSFFLF